MQIELLSMSKFLFRTSAVCRFFQCTCTVEIRYIVLYIGVDQTVRTKLEGILFTTDGWKDEISENTFVAGGTSTIRYSLATFGQSSDGMYLDFIYIVYNVDFELAPEEIETLKQHTLLCGLFNWATCSTEEKKRNFGITTNKRFENYFRVKVLEELKCRNEIDSINYEG